MILFRFFDVELLGVPVSCIIVLSFDNGIACIKPFVDEDEVYAAAGASRDGRDGYSRDSFYAPLKAGDVVNITRLQVGTFFPMK